MDNMISVINDNLKNVVNGIKSHKGEITKALDKVIADMDEKGALAEELKSQVEHSKDIISSLEDEISTLEQDLKELNEKFGDSFKETVAAGNKEINSKIIKDRASISAETKTIEQLTDKAKLIKNDLIDLKTKKEALEKNLEDTKTLEAYYGKRINAVIEYSLTHQADLESFALEEEVNLDLIANLDTSSEDLESNVDDAVFNEIDDISEKDLSDINFEEFDLSDIATEEFDDEAFSVTKQLDSVIKEAQALTEAVDARKDELLKEEVIEESPLEEEVIIEEPLVEEDIEGDYSFAVDIPSEDIEENTIEEETEDETEDSEDGESAFTEETEEVVEESVSSEDEIDPDQEVIPFDYSKIEGYQEETEESEKEETIDLYVDEALNDIPIKEELVVNPAEAIEEVIKSSEDKLISDVLDTIGAISEPPATEIKLEEMEDINLDEMPVYENTSDTDYYEETTRELADLVRGIKEHEDTYSQNMDFTVPKEDDFTPEDATIADNADNIYGEINKYGLSANSFEIDLATVADKFNKDNFEKLMEVLKKHNIPKEALYNNGKLVVATELDNLDEVITALEESDVTATDISYVLDKLENLNAAEINAVIANDTETELTGILYKVIPYDGKEVIQDKLSLSKSELKKLKSNLSDDEYKMANMFSEIVLANYTTLKNIKVDKPMNCFIEHPKRFLFNPERLNEIFDKYDDADLVRCINKNAAVIDKL